MKTAVIIGGGLGGLFTGAILSKEGYGVTVLEKNATAGGGLQTFRRFGMDFDTGMHVIGGMQPGGNIRRICEYLGIASKIRIRDVDDDCTDELFFSDDSTTYRIAKGKDGFVNSLAEVFPDSREELQDYVEAIFNIADSIDLFNLRPTHSALNLLPDGSLVAADAFIARYVSNPRLRSVLAYMNPLYGGEGGRTPAFTHAIISSLYIRGASRFVGGSSQMTGLLTDVITGHGGQVITGSAVAGIDVDNRMVTKVTTASGMEYTADYYISDIHPCTLLGLIHGKAFTNAYRARLESIPNSYSAFSLYIKMKPGTFPYINHSIYITRNYADIWQFGNASKPWPLGLLMMTPPVADQGPWSEKVLITVPMLFDKVSRWADTTTGHRGADYARWKEERAAEVLAMVEKRFPGFTANIDKMNTSSPLTIRDYYGSKEGGISGYSKDCNNIMLSNIQVATKVRNLLLTGQNINLHGFCGVPLTAVMTSEALLGQNYVINKINETCDAR